MSDPIRGDAAVAASLGAPETLATSFFDFERYRITLGEQAMSRDLVRVGKVVGLLCLDRARGEVVLIRQFRLAAHLASGRGEMVELPAGRVERGEDMAAAAARECAEETGLVPTRLTLMFELMPAPGVSDEHAALYLAEVDSTVVPARAGLPGESEVTHPFALAVDEALSLLAEGTCLNGYFILALQWLALNRARLGV